MRWHGNGFVREAVVATAYLLWAIWLTAPLILKMGDGLPKDLGDPLLNTHGSWPGRFGR